MRIKQWEYAGMIKTQHIQLPKNLTRSEAFELARKKAKRDRRIRYS